MLQLFKISGDSLFPFYKSGQRVLCRRVFQNTPIKVNDTVVFEKLHYGLMIKRVKFVEKNSYFVVGTDALSIDSRNFGALQHHEIMYKVLLKL